MAKRINVSLQCEYTPEELNEKRDELSATVIEANLVEGKKSDAAKAFKEELDALYSRTGILARQIKIRGEFRGVECAVEMNKPVTGVKRIVRLDTGELVKDEPMTYDERQDNLFGEIDEISAAFKAADPREEPTA